VIGTLFDEDNVFLEFIQLEVRGSRVGQRVIHVFLAIARQVQPPFLAIEVFTGFPIEETTEKGKQERNEDENSDKATHSRVLRDRLSLSPFRREWVERFAKPQAA
jgi:hypothetical protein